MKLPKVKSPDDAPRNRQAALISFANSFMRRITLTILMWAIDAERAKLAFVVRWQETPAKWWRNPSTALTRGGGRHLAIRVEVEQSCLRLIRSAAPWPRPPRRARYRRACAARQLHRVNVMSVVWPPFVTTSVAVRDRDVAFVGRLVADNELQRYRRRINDVSGRAASTVALISGATNTSASRLQRNIWSSYGQMPCVTLRL